MAVTKLDIKLIEANAPGYLIAARAGIPPPRLSEYRHGKRRIPPQHAIQLARILRCNPDELIGTVDDATIDKFVTVDERSHA